MQMFQSELLEKLVRAMRLTTDNYGRKHLLLVCWQMLGCSRSSPPERFSGLEGLVEFETWKTRHTQSTVLF